MNKIGFFIGHESYINKAKVLVESLFNNTSLLQEYELIALYPNHLSLAIDIHQITQISFELPTHYRSIPFIDKMFAAAEFESICNDTKSNYI